MSVNRIKNIDEIVTQDSGSGSQTMQVIPTNINNPANDDVLIFNGTEWTNSPKSAFQELTEIHYLLVGGGGSSGGFGGGGAGGMITSWPSDLSGGNTAPRPALKVQKDYELIVTIGASNTSSTVAATYDDLELEADMFLLVALRGGHANSGSNVGGSAAGGGSASTYLADPKIIHKGGLAQGMKGQYGRFGSPGYTNNGGAGGGAGANASGLTGGRGLPSALGTAASVGHVHTDGLSYFAGGGAGQNSGSRSLGGGGRASLWNNNPIDQIAGMPNTGGGAGGGAQFASNFPSNLVPGQAGGSGICILALETASYSGITTGSPTIQQVTLDSKSYTLVIFLGDGSYTV